MTSRRMILLIMVPILAAALTAGCASTPTLTASPGHAGMAMAPLDSLPSDVQTAPVPVRESYQFAAANPEVLQELPCYCGCGAMGHGSNYDCYVAGVDSTGALKYDPHALGCSICVDITQDTIRLLREGKTVPEIRAYVDANYARYGPSNMP